MRRRLLIAVFCKIPHPAASCRPLARPLLFYLLLKNAVTGPLGLLRVPAETFVFLAQSAIMVEYRCNVLKDKPGVGGQLDNAYRNLPQWVVAMDVG